MVTGKKSQQTKQAASKKVTYLFPGFR